MANRRQDIALCVIVIGVALVALLGQHAVAWVSSAPTEKCSSDIAAWVQAVGSVVAIPVSVWLSGRAIRQQDRLHRQRIVDDELAVVNEALEINARLMAIAREVDEHVSVRPQVMFPILHDLMNILSETLDRLQDGDIQPKPPALRMWLTQLVRYSRSLLSTIHGSQVTFGPTSSRDDYLNHLNTAIYRAREARYSLLDAAERHRTSATN